MHDTLQAARERARHWREAKGTAGGVVLILDGHFVGWTAELPPAEHWVEGCLAIDEDDHIWRIDRAGWRSPLQWFDLEPQAPPPSSELPDDSAVPESETTTEP